MAASKSPNSFGAKIAVSQREEVVVVNSHYIGSRIDSGQRTEVLAVAELIIATPIDQIVSYDDMNAAAGCNVREKRWIILQATALVNREHVIVLAPKRGIGYRRLDLQADICRTNALGPLVLARGPRDRNFAS
jgi:hypothetical protein